MAEFTTKSRAVTKELRAERVAMARAREREIAAHEAKFRSEVKNAKVSLQRALHSDPILRSAVKERERRQRQEQQQAGVATAGGGFGRGTASAHLAGRGHSKGGDEALRRAREVMAKALAQL